MVNFFSCVQLLLLDDHLAPVVDEDAAVRMGYALALQVVVGRGGVAGCGRRGDGADARCHVVGLAVDEHHAHGFCRGGGVAAFRGGLLGQVQVGLVVALVAGTAVYLEYAVVQAEEVWRPSSPEEKLALSASTLNFGKWTTDELT